MNSKIMDWTMTEACEVTAADVLAFWRQAGPERWYTRDDAFDSDVRARFLALWQGAAAGQLSAWEASDDGTLALIIVLDQFPRNMFRGEPTAFASDAAARAVACRALERGVDARVGEELREFLYLPFMHSEHLADQLRCVDLFRKAGGAENIRYAEDHAAIIARFGRFPHRNRILGRPMTADEQAYLDEGGFLG